MKKSRFIYVASACAIGDRATNFYYALQAFTRLTAMGQAVFSPAMALLVEDVHGVIQSDQWVTACRRAIELADFIIFIDTKANNVEAVRDCKYALELGKTVLAVQEINGCPGRFKLRRMWVMPPVVK
jgi:hypothetical protein